ncbi:MAG: hypothetical protein JWM78_2602 [Verrucomicrobiaceae bacterium]|nr:hypothetical protein [Verrucomicrobiaceae bacterium]
MHSRCLFGLAFSIALCGCANTGEDTARANAVSAAQLQLAENSTAAWPASDWWLTYNDAQLNELISKAQHGSPSLRIAQARVELARSSAQGTRAANQPAVDLNADFSRERLSQNDVYPAPLGGSVQNNSRATLDFSYEFDFWGRQRAILDAALAEIEVARADRSAAEMVLSVAVAQSYFALQHAFVENQLATQIANQQNARLKLTQLRVQRGLSSGVEIDPLQASAANAQSDVARAQQRIDIEKHQLAALCGLNTDQLPALAATANATAGNDSEKEWDNLKIVAPETIPADLLSRRADIVAQRLLIETETKNIKAAKADFYPNVDLTAFFGVQSVSTGKLFSTGSRVWGVGPALHLPIFNRDALRAQLGSRYASYDLAVEQYNQSVLDAVRETADAGSTLQALNAQHASAETATQALRRAYTTADLRFQRGLGNQLDAINAQINLLNEQRSLNSVNDAQAQAKLALIRALGGGYDAAQATKN